MMEIPYEKYHGTGNDFAVVEADTLRTNRAELGVELSAELDADGVLFLEGDTGSEPPVVDFTLYQPDGSTAAMCGNGARVAARWAQDRTGHREFRLETPAGPRHTRITADDRVQVEMGTPTFDPEAVPVRADGPVVAEPVEGFDITAVNTGVPHAVAFVEDVDDLALEHVAPPIRHADVFPEGANATFASLGEDVAFRQRTYERGVEGETQSCGTGAVAIAAVAGRLGLIDPARETRIRPPGGLLRVTAPKNGTATLEGPATAEFEGTFQFEPRENK